MMTACSDPPSLREGVAAWNAWRRARSQGDADGGEGGAVGGAGPDLRGQDLRGLALAGADLAGVTLDGADLRDADLRGADLRGASLKETRLAGADLREARLEGAGLVGIDGRGARLADARLEGANLARADLADADLRRAALRGARLTQAELERADLRDADLARADLTAAHLVEARIAGANLRDANVSGANVHDIDYGDFHGMRGRYHGIRGLASCFGDAIFVRDARDQDYLDTLEMRIAAEPRPWRRRLGVALFGAWRAIDYGRSLLKPTLGAVVLVLLYGSFYALDLALGWGLMDFSGSAGGWFSPYYYSIVTYTTLGYGDITPQHWLGEVVVVTEVILGYLTLGLLLAILANTVARRS